MPLIVNHFKYDPKIFNQIKKFWIDDDIKYPISGTKLFKHMIHI